MKARLLSLTLAVALLGLFAIAPLTAAAAPPAASAVAVPITLPLAGGNTFTGALNIAQFAVQNGQLVALGTVTGTVTNAAGAILQTVNQAVAVPVNLAQTTGSCQILHLVLGPVDLNLLGLRVQLNQVVLDITAQQGPGNLLGNLLCAVAGLLDNGGPLQGLAGLLNNILRNL